MYLAFISYHNVEPDRHWADWLQKSIERYPIPTHRGPGPATADSPRRVFRDRTDLRASSDLEASLRQALHDADNLVVVCSPRCRESSEWVNEEIRYFRSIGRGDRIFALLVEGTPESAFPSAFGEPGPEGRSVEPVAADVRPDAGASKSSRLRLARAMLMAGLLHCDLDELLERERRWRQRWRRIWVAAAAVLVAIIGGITWTALDQKSRADRNAEDSKARRIALNVDRAEAAIHAGGADMALAYALEAHELGDRSPRLLHLLWQARHQFDPLIAQLPLPGVVPISLVATPTGACVSSWLDGKIIHWSPLTDPSAPLVFTEGSGRGEAFGPLAVSPSGDRYLVATLGARVRGTADAKVLAVMEGMPNGLQAASFSPDGRFVAGSDLFAGKIEIRASDSGELVDAEPMPQSCVIMLRYSPDGRLLLSMGWDQRVGQRRGLVKVWDAQRRHALHVVIAQEDLQWAGWSPDSRWIITCSADGSAKVWGIDGQHVATFDGHAGKLQQAEFLGDSGDVVSCDDRGKLLLWDAATGVLKHEFDGHDSGIISLDITADGRTILTGGLDGTARIWSRESRGSLVELRGHDGAVYAARFMMGGSRVVTAAPDGLRLWDATLRSTTRLLAGPSAHRVLSQRDRGWLTFEPDAARLASAAGIAQLPADLSPDSEPYVVDGFGYSVVSDGFDLAVFDDRDGRRVDSLQHDLASVARFMFTAPAFPPAGEVFAVGSSDGTVSVWSRSTRSVLRRLRRHLGAVTAVQFWDDGRRLTTADRRGAIHTWSSSDWQLLSSVDVGHPVAGLAIVPASSLAVITGGEGRSTIVDLHGKQTPRVVTGFEGTTAAVRLVADGRWAIVLDGSSAPKLLDLDGVAVTPLKGHDDRVVEIDVSTDGARFVTRSEAGVALVWRAADQQTLGRLYPDRVAQVAFWGAGREPVVRTVDNRVVRVSVETEEPTPEQLASLAAKVRYRIDEAGDALLQPFVIAGASPVATAEQRPYRARAIELLDVGRRAIMAGDDAQARSLFRDAADAAALEVQEHPADVVMRSMQAHALSFLGICEEQVAADGVAERTREQALRLFLAIAAETEGDQRADAYANAATVARALGRIDEAAAHESRAGALARPRHDGSALTADLFFVHQSTWLSRIDAAGSTGEADAARAEALVAAAEERVEVVRQSLGEGSARIYSAMLGVSAAKLIGRIAGSAARAEAFRRRAIADLRAVDFRDVGSRAVRGRAFQAASELETPSAADRDRILLPEVQEITALIVEIGEAILADHPEDGMIHAGLVGAMGRRASFLRHTGRMQDAGRLLERALGHARVARERFGDRKLDLVHEALARQERALWAMRSELRDVATAEWLESERIYVRLLDGFGTDREWVTGRLRAVLSLATLSFGTRVEEARQRSEETLAIGRVLERDYGLVYEEIGMMVVATYILLQDPDGRMGADVRRQLGREGLRQLDAAQAIAPNDPRLANPAFRIAFVNAAR
jgi:WD40 repeat protein